MHILAVDSSSIAASCAIYADGKLVAENYLDSGLTHSHTLLPMVQQCLENAGLTPMDMDRFGVSVGPGSFTGLRIGIAAVKGMAFATGKPCAAISTLEGLAYNLPFYTGLLCPAMDARCSQVYTALFACKDGIITRLLPDDAITLEALAKILASYSGQPILLLGDGALLCYNEFGKNAGYTLAPPNLRLQRAAALCTIAANLPPESLCNGDALAPLYLRLPQAERELLAKQATQNKD